LPNKTISVRIDGELVPAHEGQTILAAALPTENTSDALLSEGAERGRACRVCIVELAGTDRLLPACTTPIQDGMSIKTNSAKIALYRKMAVELLLVNAITSVRYCFKQPL